MRVAVSRLNVSAPSSSPNTDGIHISATKGVEITHSDVKTGELTSTSCNINFTELQRYNGLSGNLTSYLLLSLSCRNPE